MELASILVKEVSVMFLIVLLGIISRKKGLMDGSSARTLSNVQLLVVMPVVMVATLQMDRDPTLFPAIGLTLLLAVLFHLFAIFVADRLIRDPGDGSTAWRASKLAVVFSNAGFMGFPLLLATIGEVGLVYGALYLGVFNVVNWVWSVPTLTDRKAQSLKELLKNPTIIGFLLGFSLFLLDIQLTGVLESFTTYILDVNTPLSMLLIGAFLAEINPREAVTDPKAYFVVLLRNLLLPGVVLLLFWVTGVAAVLPGGKSFALSFLIVTSCPAATTAILMSARYGCDSVYASKLVALSTALSVVTLPLMITIGDRIL